MKTRRGREGIGGGGRSPAPPPSRSRRCKPSTGSRALLGHTNGLGRHKPIVTDVAALARRAGAGRAGASAACAHHPHFCHLALQSCTHTTLTLDTAGEHCRERYGVRGTARRRPRRPRRPRGHEPRPPDSPVAGGGRTRNAKRATARGGRDGDDGEGFDGEGVDGHAVGSAADRWHAHGPFDDCGRGRTGATAGRRRAGRPVAAGGSRRAGRRGCGAQRERGAGARAGLATGGGARAAERCRDGGAALGLR